MGNREYVNRKKYKAGDLFGSLLILGRRGRYIEVQCQVCRHDAELYGEAKYLVASDYFNKGKMPCGCSYNPKRSEYQIEVLMKRKASENGEEFLGFVGGKYRGQNTKIQLSCHTCSNTWSTCSVGNYIRGRSCPACANVDRGAKKRTADEVWVSRFITEGGFDPDVFSFSRQEVSGRLWNVFCKNCPGKVFTSDRSNLVAAKVPCDCNSGGGYDRMLPGCFYVLKFGPSDVGFTGYGITNFLKRRMVSHKRESAKVGMYIEECEFFNTSGESALNLETLVKRNFPVNPQKISGFIREATFLSEYDKVVDFARKELNEKDHKLEECHRSRPGSG